MSAARDAILGGIRRSLGRDGEDAAARAVVDRRIAAHERGTVPARGKRDAAGLADLFVEEITAVDATVVRVTSAADVPQAVADYLKSENLPAKVRMAPDERLDAIPWDAAPTVEIERGAATGDDLVTVTGAFAAIAETGTVMQISGPHTPTTLNFLPDANIVVLRAGQIVGPYEDGWDLLRQAGAVPRAVNFISGPSRTADIEQTLQLGAHGPRRLHVVLIDGEGDSG